MIETNKAKEFDREEMERDVKQFRDELACKCPVVSSGNSTKSLSVFSQLAGSILCIMKQT